MLNISSAERLQQNDLPVFHHRHLKPGNPALPHLPLYECFDVSGYGLSKRCELRDEEKQGQDYKIYKIRVHQRKSAANKGVLFLSFAICCSTSASTWRFNGFVRCE